jgi:hypothetical protein
MLLARANCQGCGRFLPLSFRAIGVTWCAAACLQHFCRRHNLFQMAVRPSAKPWRILMNKPLTLDDVVEAIMIEEEEPAYDAMTRWIARFPQFKKELVSFFGTWAIQAEQIEEPQTIDSESIASRGVSYALSLIDKRDATQSIKD